MCIEMHLLREPLQTDRAEVGLLPGVNQLVPVQFTGGGEPFVTKFAGVFLLNLFLKHQYLENKEV